MYKSLCLLLMLCLTCQLSAQTRIQVKRDTVSVINGELVINNTTKNQPGFLYNIGNGITQFRAVTNVLPSQQGNAGKFLTTEGVNPYWEAFTDVNSIWQSDIAALENYSGSAVFAILPEKGVFKYDGTSVGLSINHTAVLNSAKGDGSHYWVRTFDFTGGGGQSTGGSGGEGAMYAPAFTGIGNTSSVTSLTASYTKTGDIVNVSGNFSFKATTVAASQVKLSLPYPVSLSVGVWGGSITGNGIFSNDITAFDQNNIQFSFSPSNTNAATYSYGFTYKTGSGTVSSEIAVSTTSLSGFTSVQGAAGTSQSFSVSASNLSGSLSLTAPTGFELSKDNSAFFGTLSFSPVSGTVTGQAVYVRLSSGAPSGTVSGAIAAASAGAATKSVNVSGTVGLSNAPNLVVGSNAITGLNATLGTAGSSKNFTLSGANLSSVVTLSSTSGFELSKDGSVYNTTLSYSISGGSLAQQTVYVRVSNAASSGTVSGSITISSTGATSQNVALSGYVSSGAAGSSAKFRLNSTTPAAFSGWTDLVGDPGNASPTVTDNTTGFGLRSTGTANWNKSWGQTCGNDNLGQLTSDGNGFYFPVEAIKSGYYNYQTYSSTNKYQLEFFNLNPAKTYRITILGSMTVNIGVTNDPIYTEYKVKGAVVSSGQTLHNWGNTSQYVQFTDILPTDAGLIDIGVYKPTGGTQGNFGCINAIQIEEMGAPSPTVVVNTTSIPDFYSVSGTAGSAKTIAVSGSYLTGNVTISTAGNFELSKDGVTYSTSISYPPTSGSLTSQTFYARIIAAASSGPVSGTITLSSPGATTRTIDISGTCGSNSVTATAKFRCNRTTPTAFSGWTDLVGDPGNATPTVTDVTTGFGLRATGTANWNKSFGQTCGNDNLGQTVADVNGFYFPAQAIKSGYYNYNNFSSTGTYQLELFNLNPAKLYRITIVGSMTETIGVVSPPVKTEYKLLGNTLSAAQNLDGWANTSKFVQFSNIVPASAGTIKISVFRQSDGLGGKFGIINAIQVEEMQ